MGGGWAWDGPKQSAAFKAKAIANRARGLCGCGREPVNVEGTALDGRYCTTCLQSQRAARKRFNKAQRKLPDHCKRCGGRLRGEIPASRTCSRCESQERKRSKERKTLTGRCRNCPAVLPPGWPRRMCDECRERDNARRKAIRARSRGPVLERDHNELCACGKPRAKGRTVCPPCRNANTAKRREQAKAEGLCAHCFKAPAVAPASWCASCSQRGKVRYDERRAAGLCCHCADGVALPGQSRCASCTETHRKNLAERYRRLAGVPQLSGGDDGN